MKYKDQSRIEDWDMLAICMFMRRSTHEEIASAVHEDYIITPLTFKEFAELWNIDEDFLTEILELAEGAQSEESND